MTFQGDSGADQLRNTSGGTTINLTYNGGSDSETLINAGTITNATLNFQGTPAPTSS